MLFSTIPSSAEVKALGFPVSIRHQESRDVVGAFANDDFAGKFLDLLNKKELPEPEKAPEPEVEKTPFVAR